MASYSFSAAPATLMGSSLDGAKGAGTAGASGGSGGLYDGAHIYRHDSAMVPSPHHTDRQGHYYHYQQQPSSQRPMTGSHATADSGDGANTQTQLTRALAGTDAHGVGVGNNVLTDYLFKQQVMSFGSSQDGDTVRQPSEQQYQHQHQQPSSSSSDISSVVAAVAAAASSSLTRARSQYSYTTRSLGHGIAAAGTHQSPTASAVALPGTAAACAAASVSSSTATTTPISADGTNSSLSSSGLADPLPGLFTSLPTHGPTEASKCSGMVAGAHDAYSPASTINNGARDAGGGGGGGRGGGREVESSNRVAPGSGLLAAAAAAAAASVVNGAGCAGSDSAHRHSSSSASVALLDAGAGYQQAPSYSRHSYSSAPHTLPRYQEQSSYALDGFSFPHHTSSATAALAPSLSDQSTAHLNSAASTAAELAASSDNPEPASMTGMSGASTANPPDLNAYSLSAFSRPLAQPNDTTAVLLGGDSGNYAAGSSSANTPGLAGSLSGVSHISGVVSPPQQQPQQLQGHYYQQQQQQQQHQQRGYGDYSSYYRSPSTTLGMGNAATAANATATSPMNNGSGLGGIGGGVGNGGVGVGGVSQLSAAAAAAAAAAMGPAYYTPAAYQQYARTAAVGSSAAAGAAYSYYYSQPSARYLPYAAYPPVRHFVSPARPFKCETCEQSFSRNHDLKRHVKIHSGVKPHKCPKCGKSFGRSDALKRHSMVKRCRSSNAGNTESSSSSPQGAESSGSTGSQRHGGSMTMATSTTSRLAPVSSLFGQGATTSSMGTSPSGTMVTSMLASRANPI